MGNSQSAELQLAVMVNILTARPVPPTDRAFWDRLLSLGATPSDVFDNFSFDVLRAIRDRQPENFASLLKLSCLTLHSVVWRHQQTKAMVTAASLHSAAATHVDPVTAATVAFVTERKPLVLNALRILSRLLSVLAEAPTHPIHTFVTGGVLHGLMDKREEERRRKQEAAARRVKEKGDAEEEVARRVRTIQAMKEREEKEGRGATEAVQAADQTQGEVKHDLSSEQPAERTETAAGGEQPEVGEVGKVGEVREETESKELKGERSEGDAMEQVAVAMVQTVDGQVEAVEVSVSSAEEQRTAANEAEAADSAASPPSDAVGTPDRVDEGQGEMRPLPASAEVASNSAVITAVAGESIGAASDESREVASSPAPVDSEPPAPAGSAPSVNAAPPTPAADSSAAAVVPSSSPPTVPAATPTPTVKGKGGEVDEWWTGQLYGSPLHSVIISTLIELCFLPSFTSSPTPTPFVVRHDLHLGRCWAAGAGFPPKLSSSAYSASSTFPSDEWQLDSNRVEVLRCLLTAISTSFFSPSVLTSDPFVLALTSSPHELTTTLAYSMLNVVLGYRAEAVLPYAYAISTDYRAPLVELSLHLLLLLLDFPTAEEAEEQRGREGAATQAQDKGRAANGLAATAAAAPPADVVVTEPHAAKAPRASSSAPSPDARVAATPSPAAVPFAAGGSVHPNLFTERLFALSAPDRSYLFQSACRLLQYGMQSSATYLPGSSGGITVDAELFILLWKYLDRDPAFLPHVLEHCDILHLLTPLLHYMYSARLEHSKLGLLYTCVFIALKLSGERSFSVELNRPIGSVASLAHIPLLSILAMPDFHEGTYADALILISHQLIVSSPNHLEALLKVLLTLLANVSPYLTRISALAAVRLLALFELFTSPSFLYATPTNHTYAQLLLEVFTTLVQYQYAGSGHLILAIVRRARAFYALRVTAPGEVYSQPMQGVGSRGHAIVFQRMQQQPVTSQGQQPPLRVPATPTSTGAASPAIAPPQPVTPVTDEEAKEQESQTAAPSPAVAAPSHVLPSPSSTPPASGVGGHVGAEASPMEWKARLPLECLFRLFDFLLPKIEQMARTTPTLTDAAVLHFIQSQTLVGILPLPHPIVVRRYVPNRFTNHWFSTYTAGLCFMKAQQGAFKVWDTAKVKLFTITTGRGGQAKGEEQTAEAANAIKPQAS